MCGIIGYIGKNKFFDFAKEGLKNLEYRGYDSAGLAYQYKGKICIKKSECEVNKLFEKVNFKQNIDLGIGHTRWATHGKPCIQNCHPHKSQDGEFVLVHNGIIENYKELKDKYLQNILFKSNTDTEIIPNLISYFYKETQNVLISINKTISLLKGNFALAILHKGENDTIYFARKDSPLVIGKGIDETYISSDLVGFGDKTEQYLFVKNYSYGYITNRFIKQFDFNGKEIENIFSNKVEQTFKYGKGKFPYYMLKEIYEIPLAIKETAKIYSKENNPLKQIPKSVFKKAKQIAIIACGTSYHAGLIGEKYIKEMCNIDCKTIIANEFLYSKEIINKRTLCIFISQSGETADTLAAVRKAKSLQSKTIAITNVTTSAITRLCDYTLPIKAGPEIGVASTKAYNAQLVCLLILANYIGKQETNEAMIDKIVHFADSFCPKKINESILPLATQLNKVNNIYFVGKSYDYITCLEACLKIKEISYIPCEAYPAGELKHGTLALITDNVPVVAIITEDCLVDKVIPIINQVKARGGKVYIFTSFDLSKYDTTNCQVIKIQKTETNFSPIINIIYFQLLAYKITLSLGYNPDRPRNLAKSVTVE